MPKYIIEREIPESGIHSARQKEQTIQKKQNKTGLPNDIKTGMENLSGISLDDVNVYYNSDKPAQLKAHAYAQGTNIYLAPGQEKHLPHEAWHVVQQKQGRVKPTMQIKGNVYVNDDARLEKEADVMGAWALLFNSKTSDQTVFINTQLNKISHNVAVIQRVHDQAPWEIRHQYSKYTREVASSNKYQNFKKVTFDGVEYDSDQRWIYQKGFKASKKKQLKDVAGILFQIGMTVGGAFAPGIADGLPSGRTENNVRHRVQGGISKELAPGRITPASILSRVTLGKEPAAATRIKKELMAPKEFIGIRLLSNSNRSESRWLLYASDNQKTRIRNLMVLGHLDSALKLLDDDVPGGCQPYKDYPGTNHFYGFQTDELSIEDFRNDQLTEEDFRR